MITLTTVSYIHEADLLCMQLEEAGIAYFIADQNLSSIQPLYSGAIGGIRIQIHEKDLDRAREILLADQQTEAGIFRCPQCGSDDIDYENISKRSAFLAMFLIYFPYTWKKQICTCKCCGHQWRDRNPQPVPTDGADHAESPAKEERK